MNKTTVSAHFRKTSPGSRITPLVLLVFLTLHLASCATSSSSKEAASASTQPVMREMDAARQVKEMNERLMLPPIPVSRKPAQDYKVGPDDLLEISVFEDEKLNKTVRVSSQGHINLPLIGILKVKGMTTGELEKEIRTLLAENYLKDPHVSVFLREFHNYRVSVLGAVVKPGIYDFTGPRTVLDVLTMSGGLREDAGRLLFLVRPPSVEDLGKSNDSDGLSPKSFVVGLEDLLIKGDPMMNLTVQHGDIVNVPVAGKVFLGGQVKSPGALALTKRLTIRQAVTQAAGLTARANGSETKIFRYSGKGTEREVLTVNLDAIQKGQAEDMFLAENDVIFVPTSGAKVAFYEFWDLFKGRIMGFPAFW